VIGGATARVAGALATGWLAGCAAIGGLGEYSTGECRGVCDAGLEDATQGGGAGGKDVVQDQASSPEVDAAEEAEAASDGAEDASESPDAGVVDSGMVLDSGTMPDASDSGCGATSTVENCSTCGVACNTSTGAPSCNGTTCGYTCNSNRQDCNGATAPDTDGCECTGTACCTTGCQTAHSSGLTSPANYYDCDPTGNTTQAEALAACTGTRGTGCAAKNTSCGGILGFGGTSTSAACGTVAGTCYCWVYSGQNPGEVHSGGGGCNIPCSSGSAWN
jgi:hypothetical protein